MNATEKRLATVFAKSIQEIRSRGDYGGLMWQAVRNFEEIVWSNSIKGGGWRMANGRVTKDMEKAIDSWAK